MVGAYIALKRGRSIVVADEGQAALVSMHSAVWNITGVFSYIGTARIVYPYAEDELILIKVYLNIIF